MHLKRICKFAVFLITLVFFSCIQEKEKPFNGPIEKVESKKELTPEVKLSTVEMDYNTVFRIFKELLEEKYQVNLIKKGDRINDIYATKHFAGQLGFQVWRANHRATKAKWIDLVIYKHSASSSLPLLSALDQDDSKGELIFDKDWDKVFIAANYIVRINSGCSLAASEWTAFISEFDEKIRELTNKDWLEYACKCGTPCEKI